MGQLEALRATGEVMWILGNGPIGREWVKVKMAVSRCTIKGNKEDVVGAGKSTGKRSTIILLNDGGQRACFSFYLLRSIKKQIVFYSLLITRMANGESGSRSTKSNVSVLNRSVEL